MKFPVHKSATEWQMSLSPDEYRITRECGTERAFTGAYWDCHDNGVYRCKCCNAELFTSDTKYDSGSGWPSFWKPMNDNVGEKEDLSHGMRRIEVLCKQCGAHLGHVFPDGPKPTGLRYCINSASLNLEKK